MLLSVLWFLDFIQENLLKQVENHQFKNLKLSLLHESINFLSSFNQLINFFLVKYSLKWTSILTEIMFSSAELVLYFIIHCQATSIPQHLMHSTILRSTNKIPQKTTNEFFQIHQNLCI